MPYNPAYNPVNMNTDELATSVKQNQQNSNIEHNQKYKPQLGPEAADGIKIARGTKVYTASAPAIGTWNVNFATDCIDGDPGFLNTPLVFISCVRIQSGGLSMTGGDIRDSDLSNVSKDGCNIYFESSVSTDADYRFQFLAIGN